MKEKLRVLDPVGQPSGIFGYRLNPEDDMMNITDPNLQPTISLDKMEACDVRAWKPGKQKDHAY